MKNRKAIYIQGVVSASADKGYAFEWKGTEPELREYMANLIKYDSALSSLKNMRFSFDCAEDIIRDVAENGYEIPSDNFSLHEVVVYNNDIIKDMDIIKLKYDDTDFKVTHEDRYGENYALVHGDMTFDINMYRGNKTIQNISIEKFCNACLVLMDDSDDMEYDHVLLPR